MTKALGALLPLSWQNQFRDDGSFRSLADTLVLLSAPLLAITNPHAVSKFITLSKHYQEIRYGSHDMQRMEVYMPSAFGGDDDENIRGLLFFVLYTLYIQRGGAWGSGMPWMYRLTALPFLQTLNMAVVIVGYRTYPDADISGQVHDLLAAAAELKRVRPDLVQNSNEINGDWLGNCIIGHSSGAHITLLMIVEHVRRKANWIQYQKDLQKDDNHSNNNQSIDQSSKVHIDFDSFVGLSGPYDISHHFDYEAGRGVEEISPMKSASGHSREDFHVNSPAIRLTRLLAYKYVLEEGTLANQNNNHENGKNEFQCHCPNMFLPKMLLVHGVDDATVPFTATSEAARILRSCGAMELSELYLAQTGHQDTVMHFMLSGKALDETLKWLENGCRSGGTSSVSKKRVELL